MFTVVAVALATVVAALVGTEVIDIRRCAIGTVRIHVPNLSDVILAVIRRVKGIPQLGIRDGSVPFDDVV